MKLLALEACPRCNGSMVDDRDHYGLNDHCLMCGWSLSRKPTKEDKKVSSPSGSTALHKETKPSQATVSYRKEVSFPLAHGQIDIIYSHSPAVGGVPPANYVLYVYITETIFLYEIDQIVRKFRQLGKGKLLGLEEFDEYFRHHTARPLK